MWAGQRYEHDWQRIAPLLGLRPDRALARTISVRPERVQRMRRRLGIEPWYPLKGLEHLLGKQTDVEIARRAGLTADTISKHRRARGIPRASMKKVKADRLLTGYLDALDKFFNS